MNNEERDLLTLFRGDAVDRGLRKAYRLTVERHKALGQPMVFCEDGQPVVVPAEDLVIPED